MLDWREYHIGEKNSRLKIDSVEVWRHEWRWLDGKTVYLPDPFDPVNKCRCMICEVGPAARKVRFAAGQLEGGLWVFYVPG